MNDLVIKKLISDYKCHAIILYGSRARGDFSSESDWDYFGLGDIKVPHDSFQINGEWIDISIDVSPNPEELIRLKSGVILHDERGEGASLVNKVINVLKDGPKLNVTQLRHNRNWIMKMLKRIERDDLEAKFRRSWLLMQLLEDYFMFRGIWYFGSKESLKYLKENDPETYALYEVALKQGATIDQIKELALKVILP